MAVDRINLAGAAFSALLVLLALLVARHFVLPLLWAGVIALATWPAYRRLRERWPRRPVVVALLFTLLVAMLGVLPLAVGVAQLIAQAPRLAQWVGIANRDGIALPAAVAQLPLAGDYLAQWWNATLGQPHGLSHLLGGEPLQPYGHPPELLRGAGRQLLRRSIDLGFSLLCLFFFYKDGDALRTQIDRVGARLLGVRRWRHYSRGIAPAIRATVNGLVLVGVAEGILLGIAYHLAGVPAASLWGAATAVLACIPFGAPVAFLAVAAYVALQGAIGWAIGIAVFGTVLLFFSDHFLRPWIIGSATRLPFLAVLFGILGGVELFGLVGLFLGPTAMALFMTLWRELQQPAA